MKATARLLARRSVQVSLVAVCTLAGLAVVVWGALWWNASRLPGRYGVMDYGPVDAGGAASPHQHHDGSLSVASLAGPAGRPDRSFTLVAEKHTVTLGSGRTIDAWTFDGRIPGPELRVRQGDLVEVTLVNRDLDAGVSIHWHGVDVPNAEDGVAGVTQDAVPPGGRHSYRFVATRTGTYWYHSHQQASREVERGLYGAFVVLRRDAPAAAGALDLTAIAHEFGGVETLNASDTLERHAVQSGTPVRLRLVNSESSPRRFSLDGAPFRLAAIDGTDLNGPAFVANRSLELAAGGRYDLTFTMPATPVTLRMLGASAALVLSLDGTGQPPSGEFGPELDPAGYGRPAASPFGPSPRFDRSFVVDIGRHLGFQDGHFGSHWTIDGHVYPSMPTFVVRRGDLVRITFVNHTGADHPMHLHGHHLLVLTRNGRPVGGSPWWVDTLNVGPGDRYEVAFRADNPGLWMLHCHDLRHAAAGLVMHVAYQGVTTPYRLGHATGNEPE